MIAPPSLRWHLLCILGLLGMAGWSFGQTGAVYVKSTPSGAEVYVDGSVATAKRTPCLISELQPGRHTIRAVLEGHGEASAEVEVAAGKIARVEMVLRQVQSGGAPPEPGPKQALDVDAYLALIAKGEYDRARKLAESAPDGANAAACAQALERRAEAIRQAVAGMIGKTERFSTKSGVRSGEVVYVDEQGITLAGRLTDQGRVLGETRFSIAWVELSAEEEVRLSRSWKAEGDVGRLALALIAFRRGDLEAMEQALPQLDDPLVRKLKAEAASARAKAADAAAEAAWRQIQEAAKGKLDQTRAKRLERMISSFLEKHSETAFAKDRTRELEELRRKVLLASPPTFPFNYALAANGATASGGSRPEELIDGNHTAYDGYHGFASTNWTASPPQHMIVTLKEPTPINVIRFKLWDGSNRFYRYKLDVSPDPSGDNWIQVADTSDKECRSWQVIFIPLQIVSRIRLTGTFNSANSDFHVVELQAYHAPAGMTREALEEGLRRAQLESVRQR